MFLDWRFFVFFFTERHICQIKEISTKLNLCRSLSICVEKKALFSSLMQVNDKQDGN